MPTKQRRRPAAHKRLNITLPARTIRILGRVAQPGDRSRLIAAAVERYVAELGRKEVARRLKEGATRRAERDLQIAEAFSAIGEDAWPLVER